MIQAVNTNFQPIFREGSALAICTQKLRDLFTKVHEFFMKLLQTILPCVFKKVTPVVAHVVQPPVPQPVQAVVAMQQQVLPALNIQAHAPQLPPQAPVAEPAPVQAVAALPLQGHVAPPAAEPQAAAPAEHQQLLEDQAPAEPAAEVAVAPQLPLGQAAPAEEEPQAPVLAVAEQLPRGHVAQLPPDQFRQPQQGPAPLERPGRPGARRQQDPLDANAKPVDRDLSPPLGVSPRDRTFGLERGQLPARGSGARAGKHHSAQLQPAQIEQVMSRRGRRDDVERKGPAPVQAKHEADAFAKKMLDIQKLPRDKRGKAALAASRASRLARDTAAAAAKPPENEMRILGETGLDETNSKAGPIVCVDAFMGLWDKILDPSDGNISPEDLDQILHRGSSTYRDCSGDLEDGIVPIDQLLESHEDVQSVALEEGPIEEVLQNLVAAKLERPLLGPLLGALLIRGDATSLIFIHSEGDRNQFFVLDPYGLISLQHFDNERGVADSFLRNQEKENRFSVFALEKSKLPQADAVHPERVYVRRHGTLTREEALAQAQAQNPSQGDED